MSNNVKKSFLLKIEMDVVDMCFTYCQGYEYHHLYLPHFRDVFVQPETSDDISVPRSVFTPEFWKINHDIIMGVPCEKREEKHLLIQYSRVVS